MLPVPITVTAEEVTALVVDTVESQPPDWLRCECQLLFAGVGWSETRRGSSYSGSRAFTTYGHVVRPSVFTSTNR